MNARAEFSPGIDRVMDDAPVSALRIPPNSAEAESSVLGGLLLNPGAWDRVADLLTDADFYRYEHRLIYGALAVLAAANRAADVVTVFEYLKDRGKDDEAGGLMYLNSLAQYVPSSANLRRYAEIVREKAVLRRLVVASDEIATAAFNTGGKPVAEIVDECEQRIFGIGQAAQRARDDWVESSDSMVALLDRIQSAADDDQDDLMPTGLHEVDKLLNGGLRPGQLVVIGARPSMGKTALAMSIGMHMALSEGLAVAMFSMEMTERELAERQMSMVSHIHLTRVQRPKYLKDYDWPRVTEAVEKIRQISFSVTDTSGLNITQLRSRARSIARKNAVKLLIVDYLGLMNGSDPKMPRVYQLEEVTKGLKALAKELGCAVMLLCQVKRLEDRINQMPTMADLRDSGSIEQDADIIVFVHRPYKAKPTLGDEWKYLAELRVDKNRNGTTGDAQVMYVGENTRFKDWPAGQARPTSQVRTKGAVL